MKAILLTTLLALGTVLAGARAQAQQMGENKSARAMMKYKGTETKEQRRADRLARKAGRKQHRAAKHPGRNMELDRQATRDREKAIRLEQRDAEAGS